MPRKGTEHPNLHDERDKLPLSGQIKDNMDREGRKLGITPAGDIRQDHINDRGQDFEDEMAREEQVSDIES